MNREHRLFINCKSESFSQTYPQIQLSRPLKLKHLDDFYI